MGFKNEGIVWDGKKYKEEKNVQEEMGIKVEGSLRIKEV